MFVAVVVALTGWYVRTTSPIAVEAGGAPIDPVVSRLLLAIAFAVFVYGCYRFLFVQLSRGASKPRMNDLRNVLRLSFGLNARRSPSGGTARAIGTDNSHSLDDSPSKPGNAPTASLR